MELDFVQELWNTISIQQRQRTTEFNCAAQGHTENRWELEAPAAPSALAMLKKLEQATGAVRVETAPPDTFRLQYSSAEVSRERRSILSYRSI